jgi:hypothetical protein
MSDSKQPHRDEGQETPPNQEANPAVAPANPQLTWRYEKHTPEEKAEALKQLKAILDYQKQAGLEDQGTPRNS